MAKKIKSVAGAARSAKAEDKKFRAGISKNIKKGTGDSFTNWIARIGMGQDNQLSAGYYNFDYVTRNRTQLEAAYRTSWLVRMATDIPPADMTREGIEIEGDLPVDQIDKLYNAMLELHLWNNLEEGLKWGRLFGGAIGVHLLDGQDMSTPLQLDSIDLGQYRGIHVFDRWLLNPVLSNLITEFGPDMGKPKFYHVIAGAPALSGQRIHHSRVIRFEGLPLTYFQRLAENLWGESIVEVMHDRLVAFDSGSMGAGQLLFKAHLRTMSIDMLRDIISSGGEAYEALIKQIQMIRFTQGNEGLTVIDAKDKFEAHSYTFSGISDILIQLGQQLAGALQIPLVRLFGMSPAGMNATGESDLRTYYDHIKREQGTHLRRPVTRILDILCRSVLGIPAPEKMGFHFRPVWLLQEKEKSDIAAVNAETVGKAFDRGLISQKVAMEELKQGSRLTGLFTNISDDDIEDADEEPPSGNEALEEPGDDDNDGEGNVKKA